MGMRTIVDVLEKLKVDDISFEKFPIDGTFDEIIEFLKEKDFKEIVAKSDEGVDEMFDSKKYTCVTANYKYKRIWFADTSKEEVSEKNPIFLIICHENKTFIYKVFYVNNRHVKYIVENDKKEFLEELNKRFGWE